MSSPKREFIVCDDYGMGGVWMSIRARSADEIRVAYPELDVLESPPDFLDASTLSSARAHRSYDIDDSPSGYLLDIIEDRQDR